jgi:hypothetical protein
LGALVPQDKFELSALRTSIAELPGPLTVSLLLQAPSQNQRLLDALRFRHTLADEFAMALRKNAGKSPSLTFELRASVLEVAVLFGWPGLPEVAVKTRGNGNNRLSYVVTADTIVKAALPKELLVLKLNHPRVLHSLPAMRKTEGRRDTSSHTKTV